MSGRCVNCGRVTCSELCRSKYGKTVTARQADSAVEHTNGVTLIAAERRRQVGAEGWSADHDDGHTGGSLAMAAVCYAAPERIYVRRDVAIGMSFADPWPWIDEGGDKRFYTAHAKSVMSNVPPDPKTFTDAESIDLLVKAGALIAAEIDRLLRATSEGEDDE